MTRGANGEIQWPLTHGNDHRLAGSWGGGLGPEANAVSCGEEGVGEGIRGLAQTLGIGLGVPKESKHRNTFRPRAGGAFGAASAERVRVPASLAEKRADPSGGANR